MPEQKPLPSAVVMQLPQEVIQTHIRMVVAEALSKNPEYLVQEMVTAVLAERTRESYRDKTIVQSTIEKLIVDHAKLAVSEWITEQAPKIKASIKQRLDRERGAIITTLTDGFADKLLSNINVNISISDR